VLILVIAAAVGLFFVFKGRFDAQAIIKHLSDDDSGG
jgi:hypothetical protein